MIKILINLRTGSTKQEDLSRSALIDMGTSLTKLGTISPSVIPFFDVLRNDQLLIFRKNLYTSRYSHGYSMQSKSERLSFKKLCFSTVNRKSEKKKVKVFRSGKRPSQNQQII